jgi:hypothetical protein
MRARPIGVALDETPKYVASATLTGRRWAAGRVLAVWPGPVHAGNQKYPGGFRHPGGRRAASGTRYRAPSWLLAAARREGGSPRLSLMAC